MDLALFDFDGTITTRGAYPEFVRLAVRPLRRVAGGVMLAPMIAGYRCGLVAEPAIRRIVSRVGFRGDDPVRVRGLGARYAACGIPPLLRPVAVDRIGWHKARGDRVVVVSASLDAYLEPWCRAQGLELICTELETANGRLTGRYRGGDCCGEEKARRIRRRYALEDYGTIYAYGDTEEDRPMLDLAHRRFFCWREETGAPDPADVRTLEA
jgi:phosphatidylglycerophosphatase C